MSPRIDEDHDYVVKIIQYLHTRHGIIFFITTKDFDALYNWWEKRIPLRVVKESISRVVERWTAQNKQVSGFQNFNYEVKKSFTSFLQLSVGSESEDDAGQEQKQEEQSEYHEIEVFFQNYPPELEEFRQDFEALFQQLKENQSIDPSNQDNIYIKLTDKFGSDEELNLKTSLFLRNLAPPLRKPQIEQKYRKNYLINKYKIPDFDLD